MIRFLQMGGYAVYLWPAFALTFIVMLLNIRWARRSLRAAQIDARRRLLAASPAASTAAREPRP